MAKLQNSHTHIRKEDDYGLQDSIVTSLIESLENNDSKAVFEIYKSLHISDIADFINIISYDKRKEFINIVQNNFDLKILLELEKDISEEIFSLLDIKVAASSILKAEIYEAVEILENINQDTKKQVLALLPKDKLKEIEDLFSYPEDSVGRITDTRAILIPESWTVRQVVDYLSSNSDSLPDKFYRVFIVDKNFKPIGAVMVSKIVLMKGNVKIKNIMETSLKLIDSDMDQEEVAIIFRKYGLVSELVVDKEGNVVGIITIEDIVDIIEEEAQEDIMLLGGISNSDLHSNFSSTVIKRFPWLFLNLLTATLVSMVISLFEGIISKIALVAVLMPIVASMGGNAATQSLTVIVRAISSKNFSLAYILKIIFKETVVASTNGILCSLILGVLSYFQYHNLHLSIIFAFSTIITLFFAGFIGTAIPIGLQKLNIDPAIASGVIITTFTDVTSFAIFLGLSSYILM